MSKTLIYLVAIFALWMYFSFSNQAQAGNLADKYKVEDFDKAQSGHGGTQVADRGEFTPGGGFGKTETTKIASGLTGKF